MTQTDDLETRIAETVYYVRKLYRPRMLDAFFADSVDTTLAVQQLWSSVNCTIT